MMPCSQPQNDLNRLAENLGRSLCRCGDDGCDLLANDLGLCRTLIGLLGQGQPVTVEALADAAGRPREALVEVIIKSQNVELDDQGRIVGAGLSLRPTPHRLSLGDRVLYAWCALDALMYPSLLNLEVEITSPCAATGAPVRARVFAGGVHDVTPATAVVSVVQPDRLLGVRQAFCDNVHFFYSAADAQTWMEAHPGARLLSVKEAYDLGQRLLRPDA